MKFLIVLVIAAAAGTACSREAVEPSTATAADSPAPATPKVIATPSNQITEADVAKLKWLEGNWKGMDGQKPFFERIRFEGSTMIVETLSDETLSKITDTARFELKDGEFGNTVGEQRSAASLITDGSVHFVPDSVHPDAPAKGNIFRFERESDGTWRAILETPEKPNKPAGEKVYRMEPWKAPAK